MERGKKMISENKKKYAFWLEPSLVDDMENMLTEANATSKGDFVRQAIKFYMAYLRQGKSIDFLSPLLAQSIKNEIESVEQNLSGIVFKLAVELAKISNMVASEYDISDALMEQLHENCSKRIAETNGIITFQQAYDHQHGG